jgi:type I restriction enzyme, S subunit
MPRQKSSTSWLKWGWLVAETVELGQVAIFSKGIGLSKADLDESGGFACVHYGELFTQYGAVINSVRSRTNLRLPVMSVEGDVLMPTSDVTPRGLAKASAIAHSDVGLGGDILIIRPDSQKVDSRYLAYAIRHDANQVLRLVRGTTIFHLYAKDMRHFVVKLPGHTEQLQIADALKTTNELIVTLERLIAKKRAIKQGMMQQLLTGKARLPGFRGMWTKSAVGDLLSFKNGLNKGGQYFGAGTPIVNFMDVMSGPIITTEDVIGCVTLTRDEMERFSVKRGDLFFTRTSETVGEVGTAAVLVDYLPNATFSGFILRGRPKTSDMDSRFLAHLFQLGAVRQQVTSSATYTTRALTNGRSLGRVMVRLPAVAEQRAVADAIADVDHEITSLQRRTDKARMVMQGMMQELLTGRIRLSVRDIAA